MKIGARITIATSVLVSATLGVYAFFDLREAAQQRHAAVEREAGRLALAVRASIEAHGVTASLAEADALATVLNSALAPWEASLLPVELTTRQGRSRTAHTGSVQPAQLTRLRTLQDLPDLQLMSQEGDRFIYALPLRVPTPRSPTGYRVAGSLELARSVGFLDDELRDDVIRTVPVLALVAVLVVLAATWLTQSLMSRPMDKLLAGIDDVAQGDLSRVLLSERDDEIGALATRFNEMTFYLRESRTETQRQNEARLELEQRLRQTEKMATIGLFAAEIAHEVGTPLNVIAARARALAKKAHSPEAVQKNVDIISEQVARITRIIQQTLDHARRDVGPISTQPIDLDRLAADSLGLHEAKLSHSGIEAELQPAGSLPRVPGDPDRLQQVVINLINNAMQAMPNGGRLRISTRAETRRRPGLERAPEQSYAVIEVADAGAGIADEERDKIFEPFYTSRRGEGGTGLGLAVCYSIVKDHDGWIDLGDAPEGGVVFSVYLPTAE
ncbi:ATP-binding protein [Haliangium sp.]|uniref:sensor histidine kinase n=1 Tax=Haliangium sp. TaxID=2663208 RepID=UPI003D0A0189